MGGLFSALHTLTIFRLKTVKENIFNSLYWFPAIGLFIGLILYLICWIWNAMKLDWIAGISSLIILAEIIITGAIHMDGLADWSDSFGASERNKKLDIMKDPHTGTFGIIAILMDLIVRFVSVMRIIEMNRAACIIIVPAISRAMMVEMCVGTKYARNNGIGAPFVKGAKNSHRVVSLFLCLLISLIYRIKGLILFFIAIIFTCILKQYFKKRFGGITGDLLGATNEINTVLLLFLGAVI